jgi:L-ribulose-5-phosphate 3-epimerase
MFKIAGHTMGTPEYNLFEAIALMKEIGAEGIEIVVQDGYQSGLPCDCETDLLQKVKDCCEEHGIVVSCLTPYNSHFDSLDKELREKEIAAIKKVVDYCCFLGAKFIRLYGGNREAGDYDHIEERRENLITSLREMGDYAASKGITLAVENHFNTFAVSAAEGAALMRDVDHPAVRILYDQANLTFTEQEDYQTAIALQQQYVAYMHVKDLEFIAGRHFVSGEVSHPKEEDRNVRTRIVGEGIVPWNEILHSVKEKGYDGWLSLEYERRWHPDDIPDAKIGMKKSVDCLRKILKEL